MHPLSLEDMIHSRRHARSKADYYPKHLFIHVLCHSLVSKDTEEIHAAPASFDIPQSRSPSPGDMDETLDIDESRPMRNLKERFPWTQLFPTEPASDLTLPQPPLTRTTTFDTMDPKVRLTCRLRCLVH